MVRIRSHVLPIIPTFYSRKLLKFACPSHCWASHGSSSNRLPVQHSTYPAFRWKAHNVASKFPLLRCAGFSPRFHVAYLNHFSHTLIPNMQNFVPWIMPANPGWSSNHALHAKGRISSPKRKSVQNDMLPPKANRPFPNAIHCKTNVGSTHIFVLRRISTPFLNDKDKNGKKGTEFCGSEKYSVPLHYAVGVSFFYIQPRFDEGPAPIFSTSNYNMRFSPNMAIKIRKSPAYRICQFHFPFPDWLDRRCGGKRRWLTLI